jgi:hypothetical protein
MVKSIKTLNILLFLYLCVAGAAGYLFRPETRVPWEAVYEWSPAVGIAGAVLIIATLVFWGAAVLKIFWNRFLSDLFKIRNITYDESLAVILILAIFSM